MAMGGVFISYRRDDSAPWAGRLYDLLVQRWGRDHIFMDVDAIAPGEDFRDAISATLDKCDVVLLVIGPAWASMKGRDGRPRILDEGDVHRTEIEAALIRKVRLIPVLVGGATLPQKSDLPESVGEVVYRNAAILDDRRFGADFQSLQSVLVDVAVKLESQRQEADERARQEAASRAQQEADERARQEAASRAQQEADERARQEAASQRQEADERARQEAASQRQEADERARQEAASQRQEADERARQEAADRSTSVPDALEAGSPWAPPGGSLAGISTRALYVRG